MATGRLNSVFKTDPVKNRDATILPSRTQVFAILLVFFLSVTGCFASTLTDIERETAYNYINKVRRLAGLDPFRRNQFLEKAAVNHADYLTENNVIGHLEEKARYKYTGEEPHDRAIQAGYESRDVTENFSAGQKNAVSSVDGLMSAIYHRLSFLDFKNDEIGIGVAKDQDGYKYVYDMGSQSLNQLCRYAIYRDQIPFYEKVCRRTGKIAAKQYDELIEEQLKKGPMVVAWPTHNATNVPVAFYEEIPDPMPDIAVSGYPVSIQFNPYFHRQIDLLEFSLLNERTGNVVRQTRLLDHKNDPNHRLKKSEFALFPLNRLEWDTVYQVTVRFRINGTYDQKKWTFKTETLGAPLFQLKGNQETLVLKSGQTVVIYIPPEPDIAFIERFRWESLAGIKTTVKRKDKNTLFLTIEGDLCEQVFFYMNGKRSFSARIGSEEKLIRQSTFTQGLMSECALEEIKNLSGYQVSGSGEMVLLKTGQAYWVEILGLNNMISSVKWKGDTGLKVDIKYIDRNILKIKVSGKVGQTATFLLANQKFFKARLVGR